MINYVNKSSISSGTNVGDVVEVYAWSPMLTATLL